MAWLTLKVILKFTGEETTEARDHLVYLTDLRARARATEHRLTVELYRNLLTETVKVWLRRDQFITEKELRDLLDEVMDDFLVEEEDLEVEDISVLSVRDGVKV